LVIHQFLKAGKIEQVNQLGRSDAPLHEDRKHSVVSEFVALKPPAKAQTIQYIDSCDRPWVLQYSMLHSDIMNGKLEPSRTKFLLVRPHDRAGLGNRIRAITGALAVAASPFLPSLKVSAALTHLNLLSASLTALQIRIRAR
jgi:hypothetical protein